MKLNNRRRLVLGFISMVLGLTLMVGAGHLSGETRFTTPMKGAAVSVSALTGVVLTFVVARRLLTYSHNP